MHGLRRHPSRCHCKGPETQRKLKQGLGSRSPLKFLDNLQTGLSVVGNFPIIGNVADGINVAISGGRAAMSESEEERNKHLKEMAWNATAMIPGTQGLTAARTTRKVIKNVANTRNNLKAADEINKNLKDRTKVVQNKPLTNSNKA